MIFRKKINNETDIALKEKDEIIKALRANIDIEEEEVEIATEAEVLDIQKRFYDLKNNEAITIKKLYFVFVFFVGFATTKLSEVIFNQQVSFTILLYLLIAITFLISMCLINYSGVENPSLKCKINSVIISLTIWYSLLFLDVDFTAFEITLMTLIPLSMLLYLFDKEKKNSVKQILILDKRVRKLNKNYKSTFIQN